MNIHGEYARMLPIWDFMRDAWIGEMAIRLHANRKGYLHKKKQMNKEHFEFYANGGRYPEIVSRMIRLSVDRTLSREPIGMSLLCDITGEDPEKFLNWALTETAIVGGFGSAFDLSGSTPRLVCYNLENIPNWSGRSVVFNDMHTETNQYGLVEDVENMEKIYFLGEDGRARFASLVDEAETMNELLTWRSRSLNFVPAVRMATCGKPLFHGLARSTLSYYQNTALLTYILNQIVPQPVLVMPEKDTEGEWDMEKLYEGGTIEYGIGKIMKLPHGADFKIVSPVVRSVSEIRHSLIMIKDEMIAQGAQRLFQRGGQSTSTNEDAIRLHANDQIMVFGDVLRTVETAINRLLKMHAVMNGDDTIDSKRGLIGGDRRFKFRLIDFNDIDVDALVENEAVIGEGKVEDELAQHGILTDQLDELADRIQDRMDESLGRGS